MLVLKKLLIVLFCLTLGVSLVAACGGAEPAAAPVASVPTEVPAPTAVPTPIPTEAPTPEPAPTAVPTVAPAPTAPPTLAPSPTAAPRPTAAPPPPVTAAPRPTAAAPTQAPVVIQAPTDTSKPPHIFIGRATLDGIPVPDGTVITAWVGDVAVAASTVGGGAGKFPSLQVFGAGQTVTFKIGDLTAGESFGPTATGGADILVLTASSS